MTQPGSTLAASPGTSRVVCRKLDDLGYKAIQTFRLVMALIGRRAIETQVTIVA
jgi:hypothetical protein